MRAEVVPSLIGLRMGINYGFDRVRFTAPVPTGSRIRGRFTLKSLDELPSRDIALCYTATVELEGVDRPALVADWLTRAIIS